MTEWFFDTAMAHELMGRGPGGSWGVNNALTEAAFCGVGAEIMGRNKFGWQCGPWEDESWRGRWGEEPRSTPLFVLTHYPRPSLQMEGGTVFHFRDASPQDVLAEVEKAANGLDVRIGGGPPPSSATSSQPTSSTSCTSCSAAASAPGTARKPSSSASPSRPPPPPSTSHT